VSDFELELSFLTSERLRLDAKFSYLDTELQSFNTQQVPNDLIFPIGAPIPLETANAAGNELTSAPKFSLYLSGVYSQPLGNNLIADLKVTYRYQDDVFFLETNQSINQVTALGSFPNAAISRPQQFGAELIYNWN